MSRVHRHGPPKRGFVKCMTPECTRDIWAKRRCRRCYSRYWRGISVWSPNERLPEPVDKSDLGFRRLELENVVAAADRVLGNPLAGGVPARVDARKRKREALQKLEALAS